MAISKAQKLDIVFNVVLTKQEREALADRARVENTSSNAIARAAIRAYLAQSPRKEPTAA